MVKAAPKAAKAKPGPAKKARKAVTEAPGAQWIVLESSSFALLSQPGTFGAPNVLQ